MADAYVEGKVREALNAARGSRAVAQKLLITWAAQDERLLLGMAQPFLKAIAGAAVEGALRRAGPTAGRAAARSGGGGGALSREALERVLSRMGDDPQPRSGTGSGGGPIRSATTVVTKSTPAPDGVTHANAMMTIAKAFAAKKVR